ncbi:HNH endonuclease [Rhizobium sp. CFBP 13726]|uniref:HNH endonuclease n=1 Tax=Rhizobium sp. CFBP 13726 TaxID=2775296 RepID=UPI0017829B49|nr:HNH endonuclease [Rhizobium sp. CFBP 13726]MBD8651524.1 HNH endonuclease [Rhizobium sp. CFBP 13726]
MSRSTPEWIAKNDDAKIPDRVKVRILERENFICHLTGLRIDPLRDEYDFDHKVSLILGGSHRESNLFPAFREEHRKKTAVEVGIKSKIAKVKKKHLGITKPKSSLSAGPYKRKMNGDVVDTRTGEVVSR